MFFMKFLLTTAMAFTFTFVSSDDNDIELLKEAIESSRTDRVKELLEFVKIDTRDSSGWNILQWAVFNSSAELFRLLVSHGGGRIVNEKLKSPIGTFTPLWFACLVVSQRPYLSYRIYEIMEALLRAGGDPNITDSNYNSPLHVINMASEARLLISYGADVNARNIFGYTPAHWCIVRYSPSRWSLVNEDREILYALIDGKANFSITTNLGDTIFHKISPHPEHQTEIFTKDLVQSLVRNGAPLDALNNVGELALTQFLKLDLTSDYLLNGKHPNIRYENLNDSFYAYMVEAGADVNASNGLGETMLHLSVCKYHSGFTKWLLERGANVEVQNGRGDTPLLALLKQEKWNCIDGNVEFSYLPPEEEAAKIRAVINVLVMGGADITAADQEGHNAMYYANKTKLSLVDPFIAHSLKKKSSSLAGRMMKAVTRKLAKYF